MKRGMNEEFNRAPTSVCDSERNGQVLSDKSQSAAQKLDQTLDSTRELIIELNAWLEIQEPRKRALCRCR